MLDRLWCWPLSPARRRKSTCILRPPRPSWPKSAAATAAVCAESAWPGLAPLASSSPTAPRSAIHAPTRPRRWASISGHHARAMPGPKMLEKAVELLDAVQRGLLSREALIQTDRP